MAGLGWCLGRWKGIGGVCGLRVENPPKTSKIDDFWHFWWRLAAKRLAVQSPAAYLLNQLGMGNILLWLIIWSPTFKGWATYYNHVKNDPFLHGRRKHMVRIRKKKRNYLIYCWRFFRFSYIWDSLMYLLYMI